MCSLRFNLLARFFISTKHLSTSEAPYFLQFERLDESSETLAVAVTFALFVCNVINLYLSWILDRHHYFDFHGVDKCCK